MAKRSGRRRRGAAYLVGMLGLALSLAVIGLALRSGGLSTAANVAQLVSVVLVVTSMGAGLVVWWRGPDPPGHEGFGNVMSGQARDVVQGHDFYGDINFHTTGAPPEVVRRGRSLPVPTSADVTLAKNVLADLVGQQWRFEATLRSLDDPDPIPVQWHITEREEVTDHPANLTPGQLLWTASSDDVTALVQEFRQLRRRRLVILGGPGSGKTTLAVQLLREILATRRQHEDDPVPVLLSLASWNTKTLPRMQDWLATRLAQDYPALRAADLGPDMPRTLATRGQVLPVLDGLDELSPHAQGAVITALNRSLSGDDHLILTCRTTEYSQAVTKAGGVLTSAVTIEPEPLAPAVAADFLRRCLPARPGRGWEAVFCALSTTRSPAIGLAEITQTPLGLWLLRAVYITPGRDPAPLLDPERFPDATTLRSHLFDHLIEALIDTRPPSNDPAELFRPRRTWDPADARRWLGFLACLLGQAQTSNLDWWQLARYTLSERFLRLTFGLIFGLAYGLAAGIALGPAVGLAAGLAHGLAYIFAYGKPVWQSTGPDSPLTVGILLPRLTGQLAAAIAFGIAGFLIGGLTAGVAAAIGGGNGVASAFASTAWLANEPGYVDLRLHKRSSQLFRQFPGQITYGLACGLGLGLLLGVASGHVPGLTLGIWAGIAVGGGGGLAVGLGFGLIGWAEAPVISGSASTPGSTLAADRTLTVLHACGVGIPFGCTAGFAFGLPAGVAFGIALALIAGPTSGDRHAWVLFKVATIRLVASRQLPSRLTAFLDDAHRLGLLRTVGPAYQFRHAALQDRLITTGQPRRQPVP